MHALEVIVRAIWQSNSNVKLEIRSSRQINLPVYVRASKNWDLLHLYRDTLVVAIESKTQRGHSFRNKFNNRTEEVLSLATHSQMAIERVLFGLLKP